MIPGPFRRPEVDASSSYECYANLRMQRFVHLVPQPRYGRTSICRPAGSHTWLWSDAELARTAPDVARHLRDAAGTDALQQDQARRVRQACIRTAFSVQAGKHCCACWPSCMRHRTAGCMIRANMSVLSDVCAKRRGNLVMYALMDTWAV